MVGFNKTPKFKQGRKSMTPKKFPTGDGEAMDVDKSSMKKKALNSSFQTPGGKNMNKGMRVSFQLPESPKSATKAKHPPTPMPKRKTMTPVSGKMEKSNMEFRGMSIPGKQQLGSGKKGGKGQGSAMQQLLGNEEDDDDDEDDDDFDLTGNDADDLDDDDDDDLDDDDDSDDDDDDDDLDSEDDDIKEKLTSLKQKLTAEKKPQNQQAVSKKNEVVNTKGINKLANAKKVEDNTPGKKNAAKVSNKRLHESDDEDDDEEEEEDDDDEDISEDDDDDDDDVDSDEDEIKKKLLAIKQKQTETPQQKASLKNKASQNKPAKTNSEKKEATSPVKKTPQVKQEKSPAKTQNVSKEVSNMDAERKRERDSRHLFVRGIPTDATVEELKALSPDIIGVNIPQRKAWRAKITRVFAFLEFASEKKAEENYAALQNKKFRGQPLCIDYSGEKSKRFQELNKNVDQKVFDKKRLFVSGLPCNATIDQVAQIFPKAITISLNVSPEFRNASVIFLKEEDAEEALKMNEKPKVNGKVITVLYALEKPSRKQKRKARSPKKGGQASKKFKSAETAKIVPKQESEEEEDDDDDEEDSDE